MHAGLVNGGGLLLSRFALLFFDQSFVLNLLFLFGFITLVLGGIWKLIQTDIKRMLACSTMTQMGFMIMQCGLGLFSAGLAHLCWHGLFKAFLFLQAGSTIGEQKRNEKERTASIGRILTASVCGAFGACGFIIGSDFSFSFNDTTIVLLFFAWIAATQIGNTILETMPLFSDQRYSHPIFFLLFAISTCSISGFAYGSTIKCIESLAPAEMFQPQPFHSIHLVSLLVVFLIYLAMNLKSFIKYEQSIWWKIFYVRMLNASQPNSATITPQRNQYKC
jgi:NAD(P)H-quinone oxidoreductase subunit 5